MVVRLCRELEYRNGIVVAGGAPGDCRAHRGRGIESAPPAPAAQTVPAPIVAIHLERSSRRPLRLLSIALAALLTLALAGVALKG
jgi:hypothetical protein